MNDDKPRLGGLRMTGSIPVAPIGGPTQQKKLEKELAAADEAMMAGNFALAEIKYRAIIAEAPDIAIAHNNLGNTLSAMEHYAEALVCYDRALELKPDSAGGHNNRGNILWDMKRFEDALEAYDRAITLNPNLFEAHNNRGNALLCLDHYEDAIKSWDMALKLNPRCVEAQSNRGKGLFKLRRYDEAIACWDNVLESNPHLVEAYANRGDALFFLERYDEALKNFTKVSELKPESRFNWGYLVSTKLYLCDWTALEQGMELVVNLVRAGKPAVPPFQFLAFSESAADQRKCSEFIVQDRYPRSLSPFWQGKIYDHDRIRVAYVSADFCNHPTSLLMAGVYERHDRSRFEVYGISIGAKRPGEVRTRIENALEHFLDVAGKNPKEIAGLIRELEIDIAIDFQGHTRDGRPEIFALRPAPVQTSWVSNAATFGGDYMDYFVADRIVIPEGQQGHYSEKIAYLPDTYLPTDSRLRIADHTPDRAEMGLPGHGFVFCSFNQNYKILPRIFDIWMRLLQKVENSVLWIWVANQLAQDNLRREAKARGVDPKRLVFARRLSNPEHLARYRLADLFLDTLPCNGHTTVIDALWAGLPVVTCTGTTFAGRVATSLLHAAGMSDLVTDSLEAYEALALRLARDRDALTEVRKRLLENRDHCRLFDTDRTRRHIEAAYEIMWEKSQAGKPAEGFAVPPIDD